MICFRLINSHHSQFPAVKHHHIVALRYSADFNSVIFETFARVVAAFGLCSYLYSGVIDFCLRFKSTALAGQSNICKSYLHFSAAYPMITCCRHILLSFCHIARSNAIADMGKAANNRLGVRRRTSRCQGRSKNYHSPQGFVFVDCSCHIFHTLTITPESDTLLPCFQATKKAVFVLKRLCQDFLRSLPDSNWSKRFCRPVPNLSAKRPCLFAFAKIRLFCRLAKFCKGFSSIYFDKYRLSRD